MSDMVRRRSWPFRVVEHSPPTSGKLGGQSAACTASTSSPPLPEAGQPCESRHDPHRLDAAPELRYNAVTTPP